MTSQQKFIITKLLEGCTIFSAGPGKIRLRDPEGRPIGKVTYRTFYWLNRNLLRKQKGLFVINKTKVRQLHGNSFAKRLYKGKVEVPAS